MMFILRRGIPSINALSKHQFNGVFAPVCNSHGTEQQSRLRSTYAAAAEAQPQQTTRTFDDHEEAFKNKSTLELLRAYAVFKACSSNFLLDRQMQLIYLTYKVLGRRLFRKLMMASVYGQFMGGEENSQVLRRLSQHRHAGVYPMLQYTARETHGVPKELKAISRHGDTCDMEALWDSNVESCLNSIDIGAQSQDRDMYSIVTTKFTFFGPTTLMRRMNTLIKENWEIIKGNTDVDDVTVKKALDLTCTELQSYSGNMVLPSKNSIQSKSADALVLNIAFNLEFSKQLNGLRANSTIALTEEEESQLYDMWTRLKNLAMRSQEKGVIFGIDAEQSYLQLFFDVFALDLMRIVNKHRTIVQNTFQTYLKYADEKIKLQKSVADEEGFSLGVRIVRGAYMDEERRLSAEHGYEDPVNPTYDATTDMYHRTAVMLLQWVKNQPEKNMKMLFASHNEDTIKFIVTKINELGINLGDQTVSVAQLLGMRDHVSFTLGQAGFPVHKLLHYGNIEECVAYLSRRMVENRGGLSMADRERHLLGAELKRRLTNAVLFR